MAVIVINQAELNRLFADPSEGTQRLLTNVADRTRDRARSTAKRKTGKMANSIQTRTTPPLSKAPGVPGRAVVVDVPYSQPVHEGSVPHIIRAKNKQALHFFWANKGGLETFAPRNRVNRGRAIINKNGILIVGKGFVRHPGAQPDRFLVQALEETINTL